MCLESRKSSRRWELDWTLEWTQRERKKAASPQTGRGRYIKRLQRTARTTHLGILVARRTNVMGDWGSLQLKPIIQWRSWKCTGWRGRDAVGSQSTKAWKNSACLASGKPIKQHTDFTVITFELKAKEVGGRLKWVWENRFPQEKKTNRMLQNFTESATF